MHLRQYNHSADWEAVGQLLERTHNMDGIHMNWMQPRWEYMHFHPYIRNVDLRTIGVWTENDEIVGVVHPEHLIGTAFFEIDPAHAALKKEMLDYAEEHICAVTEGLRSLHVFISDRDTEFQQMASARGYEKRWTEQMSRFVIPDPFPRIALPEGYRLQSLADDDSMTKVSRLLWRGFNHPGEPPTDGIEDRKLMQSAPNFRKDLNVVAVAPNGDFVSYGGLWYEPVNRFAYVEPVCTDPDHRRKKLATAAVLEGIRRCGKLGATVAYVGTDKPVYLAMGFRPIRSITAWRREWT